MLMLYVSLLAMQYLWLAQDIELGFERTRSLICFPFLRYQPCQKKPI